MKRILGEFIAVAAALAIACGGGDNEESSTDQSGDSEFVSGAPQAPEDSTGATLQTNQSGITVVGTGRAELEPDVALISLGVGSGDSIISSGGFPSLQLIKEEELQAVVDALEQNGVNTDDIYVSTFSANVFGGFGEGGAQIAFTWNNPDDVDTVIEAARNALREDTDYSLQSLSVVFSKEDCADAERDAQEAALADARTRAEQLADLADLSLGEITSVSEVPGDASLAVLALGGSAGANCLEIEELSALSGYPPGGINTPSEITVTSQLAVTFTAE
jgi:uncharacterized protein YggE